MITGTVKRLFTERGYLFVQPDHGEDIFIHFRDLRRCGLGELIVGDRVELLLERDREGKTRACDIRLIGGA